MGHGQRIKGGCLCAAVDDNRCGVTMNANTHAYSLLAHPRTFSLNLPPVAVRTYACIRV